MVRRWEKENINKENPFWPSPDYTAASLRIKNIDRGCSFSVLLAASYFAYLDNLLRS